MKTGKSFKETLKELENKELIEIIMELRKVDKKNVKFLDVYLKNSDEIDFDNIIEVAKSQINYFINGSSITGNNCLKLRDAKKVISETSKIIREHDNIILDLKLYYVETCNDFTCDYGDISESFYNSVISTFWDFSKGIIKKPQYYKIFESRLEKLFNSSRDIGWGYSDEIAEIYFQIKNAIEVK